MMMIIVFFTKIIESWNGFEYSLREEDRIVFNKMLMNVKKRRIH